MRARAGKNTEEKRGDRWKREAERESTRIKSKNVLSSVLLIHHKVRHTSENGLTAWALGALEVWTWWASQWPIQGAHSLHLPCTRQLPFYWHSAILAIAAAFSLNRKQQLSCAACYALRNISFFFISHPKKPFFSQIFAKQLVNYVRHMPVRFWSQKKHFPKKFSCTDLK